MRRARGFLCLLGGLALAFSGHCQPANDAFASRQPILAVSTTITNSLAGATFEPGEPVVDSVSTGQTAWWAWTAPSNGVLTLSVSAPLFQPFVSLYTGDDLGVLSLVASNNFVSCYENCGCHPRVRESVTFHVTKDAAYSICLDSALLIVPGPGATGRPGFWIIVIDPVTGLPISVPPDDRLWITNTLAGGDFTLNMAFTPAPTNDDFAQPALLTGFRTRSQASNFAAGKEPNEPDHGSNPGGSSVWFSWTAPASGRVTISTNEVPPYSPPGTIGVIIIGPGFMGCGEESIQNPPPPFFPLFAAYTGLNLASATRVPALPLGLDAYPHAIVFDAVKGQQYRIAFDGNLGTFGDITLYLALTQPASNDDFARRMRLHGIYARATSYNAGATREAREPAPPDGSSGKTVWWTWTAPVSGPVLINLQGSEYSYPVSVFTGSRLGQLKRENDGVGSWLFTATQGQTYQIAVSDAGGLGGGVQLTLEAPVVEAVSLTRVGKPGRTAILTYRAVPGQVLMLQSSENGLSWKNVLSATARSTTVTFAVRAPQTRRSYRAIIVDCFDR
jgi:hypothetical protein